MKIKKWQKVTIGAISIIGIILLLMPFMDFNFFVLTIQGLEPVIQQSTWQGYNVTITSAYIGSLTNIPFRQFCDSNDADLTISNTYDLMGDLSLSSSISGSRTCGGNYIYADLDLPAGTLLGNYDLSQVSSSRTDSGDSESILKISSDTNEASLDLRSYVCDPNSGGCNNSISPSSFNFNITNPSKVHIELLTGKSTSGSSLALVNLNFIPKTECSSNCISPCEGKTASCVSGECVIAGECIEPPKPITIYLIIGGILVGVGLLTLVYFKVMRKK